MDAERKQVTVLFTDMVGFTSFSERSGEEAAFTLMRSLAKLMDEAVREQGGFVRGFTGDGVMAVFGAPVAFEDAPLRAASRSARGRKPPLRSCAAWRSSWTRPSVSKVVSFEGSPAMASWLCLVRRSLLRTRRFGPVARRSVSCNGSRQRVLTSKRNMACAPNYASAPALMLCWIEGGAGFFSF